MPIHSVRNDRARSSLLSLLREERTIALTGAGLSAWAGYPSWPGLLDHLIAYISEHGDGTDADYVYGVCMQSYFGGRAECRIRNWETGKVPQIKKAIRILPIDKQPGLGAVSLRGMVNVDANQHSFFKHVIEQRAENESNKALYYWLKILANSGSYGLFVELNPNDSRATKLTMFSGEESYPTTTTIDFD